jgi:hypothetical protein
VATDEEGYVNGFNPKAIRTVIVNLYICEEPEVIMM